ncbi:MAG: hypothetical protein ABIZ81_11155 [Opitutaceae bacterium]
MNRFLLRWGIVVGLACMPWAVAADSPPPKQTSVAEDDVENDDVISLAAYNVKADRIDDFGLRVRMAPKSSYPKTLVGFLTSRYVPMVWSVTPNTAAAKAGLQPGERILKSDGESTSVGLVSSVLMKNWLRKQKRKWQEVAAGKQNVIWTLELQSRDMKTVRTVKLVIPTPPPRWGASVWRPPEGRPPSTVRETGPLAERARAVLDNGVLISLHERYAKVIGLNFRGMESDFASGREPTGYQWSIGREEDGTHRIFVTQFRGRTDIFLEVRSISPGHFRIYHTSPSGVLEHAWPVSSARKKSDEMPLEEFRAGFAHELDLWTNQVAKVSPRWPFELKPGYDANAIIATLTPMPVAPTATAPIRLPEDFLKLRPATEPERELFTTAYGKLGAEPDRWAYTETSRGIDDTRARVIRVDPSKPEAERSVLLSVDGKAPTAGDLQQWRDDGGDTSKPLGEIPPLASFVDLTNLRVFQDEPAALVFELPMKNGGAEFPAEKFQALFRVNKTRRSFEHVTVKLRDSFRIGGVVQVTEAGVELRFHTLDPALPPQPVLLKAGGGARVLLVKFSRSFEAIRGDFSRVTPFEEAAAPAK